MHSSTKSQFVDLGDKGGELLLESEGRKRNLELLNAFCR